MSSRLTTSWSVDMSHRIPSTFCSPNWVSRVRQCGTRVRLFNFCSAWRGGWLTGRCFFVVYPHLEQRQIGVKLPQIECTFLHDSLGTLIEGICLIFITGSSNNIIHVKGSCQPCHQVRFCQCMSLQMESNGGIQ